MKDIFRLLPKPCNTHIHFSGFINYKTILEDIINNKEIFDKLLINKRNLNLSFYKENNYDLYEKITLFDIEKIKEKMNNNKHLDFAIFGDVFYGIIRNYNYFCNFYLPNIVKKMNKHNIYYMEIRTKLGSCVDETGKNIPIISELEELYKYKKYFSIIVQSSKCKKDSCKFFEEIIKLTKNTKFFEFIKGYDLVGDENKCLNLKFYYENLKKLQDVYKINYYMHAGEDINGQNSLINMDYAIKLNCIRIGHGIYSFDNLKLLNEIKEKKIYLEICPLSNKILFNYSLNKKNIIENYEIITIGSDDDNKFKTNLSSDYLYLYNSGIDLNIIKKLLLNSAKFNPYFDIAKFNTDYEKFLKIFD